MRSLCLLLLLTLVGVTATAQTQDDELSLSELGFSQGVGEFTQHKYFKFLSKPIVSNGAFVVAGQDLLWQTSRPVFSQILLKEDAIYRRLNQEQPFELLVKGSQINQLLSAVLTGNIKAKDWTITTNTPLCFELVPLQAQMSQLFSHVNLCKTGDASRQVTLFDPQDNKTIIMMTLTSNQLTPAERSSLELR